jgi:hypothetical protein
MSLRNRIISIAILVGCFSPIPAFADECYSIADKMDSIAKEYGSSSVLTITLRKSKDARYIFFFGSNLTASENNLPWMLASRTSNDPRRYCTIGKGTSFEVLASMQNSNFAERFGLPGSGYPRCSDAGDALGPLKVRAWAAKELGKGEVISFLGDGIGFSLLTGEGGYWILLKSDRVKTQICYFDRGDDFLKQEYSLRR